MKRVAILATGDEIINGDLVNTNGQIIAQRLFEHGITPGQQMTVADNQLEIHQSLITLAKQHDVIITIGGLGPTSDDLTRFAIGDFCKQELIFNEQSWQRVLAIGKKFNIHMHESNRQQAYFPETASIIANPYGSADACIIKHGSLSVIMLPGPPRECLPIFDQDILPYLMELNLAEPSKLYRWRLLGIPEAEIAANVTDIVTSFGYSAGFRAHFPYIEVKLLCKNPANLNTTCQTQLETLFAPYLASRSEQSCKELLINHLVNHKISLIIDDNASFGYLHSQLLTPQSYPWLSQAEKTQALNIKLSGLNEFWQSEPYGRTTINISINGQCYDQSIPLRGQTTLSAFVEYSCWVILKHLMTSSR
ncbi:NMN amidohydrolase-like protein YfaY [Piscirickettsia salmonis]|uniref:Molybdopterin-binding protein MoaB n=1 Tax=Piscirickettsia salmonis TaxID=1238 RepID=A0AAC8VGN4_PISSA|nr:competence/damage-inducible protein A [Piscirickettsia salmonis]ALB22078.1 molybdopterin-binding protein MoaB [Piscirickettsia salmonis]QGN99307.1 NMN amidohydrolase-like protein YfaY [Piscirickettsia salmonis]QGO02940.1 NMN amidohydrolase-like protein YfaY [Piscirickettsia salmonis]QGO13599.1 NMN amidohydrolase-like protein YfaY [Piscirickettsia salmonis]QGO20675.1 NMN amidohydrolase-like protein YfaY [Piscirickettsia salmonis]